MTDLSVTIGDLALRLAEQLRDAKRDAKPTYDTLVDMAGTKISLGKKPARTLADVLGVPSDKLAPLQLIKLHSIPQPGPDCKISNWRGAVSACRNNRAHVGRRASLQQADRLMAKSKRRRLRTYSKVKELMALAPGLPTIFQNREDMRPEGLRASGSTNARRSTNGDLIGNGAGLG